MRINANMIWDTDEPWHLIPTIDIAYNDSSFDYRFSASFSWLRFVAFVEEWR